MHKTVHDSWSIGLIVGVMILMLALPASAQQPQPDETSLDCQSSSVAISPQDAPIETEELPQQKCDVAVDVQVKVNGGDYVDADSSTDAVGTFLGEVVTWKVNLKDVSVGYIPQGTIGIAVAVPFNTSIDSASANAGSFADGVWIVAVDEPGFTAELILTTTALKVGGGQAIATLTTFTKFSEECVDCFLDSVVYSDDDSANDIDEAHSTVFGEAQPDTDQPQTGVLGASTVNEDNSDPQVLAATGTQSVGAVLVGVGTMISAAVVVRRRKSQV